MGVVRAVLAARAVHGHCLRFHVGLDPLAWHFFPATAVFLARPGDFIARAEQPVFCNKRMRP